MLKLSVALALSAMVPALVCFPWSRDRGRLRLRYQATRDLPPWPLLRRQLNLRMKGPRNPLRFYLARVKRDPEDTRSLNALAEYYLQQVRESGNEDYRPLALDAARAPVAAVEPARNLGGLTALAHCEFSFWRRASARVPVSTERASRRPSVAAKFVRRRLRRVILVCSATVPVNEIQTPALPSTERHDSHCRRPPSLSPHWLTKQMIVKIR